MFKQPAKVVVTRKLNPQALSFVPSQQMPRQMPRQMHRQIQRVYGDRGSPRRVSWKASWKVLDIGGLDSKEA